MVRTPGEGPAMLAVALLSYTAIDGQAQCQDKIWATGSTVGAPAYWDFLRAGILKNTYTHTHITETDSTRTYTHTHITETDSTRTYTHTHITETDSTRTYTHTHITETDSTRTYTHTHITETDSIRTYTHTHITETDSTRTYTHTHITETDSTRTYTHTHITETDSTRTYTHTHITETDSTRTYTHTHITETDSTRKRTLRLPQEDLGLLTWWVIEDWGTWRRKCCLRGSQLIDGDRPKVLVLHTVPGLAVLLLPDDGGRHSVEMMTGPVLTDHGDFHAENHSLLRCCSKEPQCGAS
ncbi:hypothetical protein RRG08_004134 [Elysia crispata]|uniref:Uncharacterized protein n=1 Tax=Elysia crispata TaxID=231223 RepID=A0AAE0YWB4_9GAST|nr:hypothetical protein RRG08_004134 [Elysia crispata]